MWRCRRVAPDESLLEADLSITCFEGYHLLFSFVALVFFVVYIVGIPALLYRHMLFYKSSIKNAPDYILLKPVKSIYQFYKPDCYQFEMYFWLEKVTLRRTSCYVLNLVRENFELLNRTQRCGYGECRSSSRVWLECSTRARSHSGC